MVKFKISHAKRWADRLVEISDRFDAGDCSLAEYMVEIRAVKEITNLAFIEAKYGNKSFLSTEAKPVKTIEV